MPLLIQSGFDNREKVNLLLDRPTSSSKKVKGSSVFMSGPPFNLFLCTLMRTHANEHTGDTMHIPANGFTLFH